jgi:response regulator RpfG family c-di-GMP phosphodiesterase
MKSKQVLIITEQQQKAAQLVDQIGRQGWRLLFAENCKSARSVLKDVKVDLVLSQITLPDGTAEQFLKLLEGNPVDVFFANSIEDNAFWLYVLIAGENRWWKPTLVSSAQFSAYLETRFLNKDADPFRVSNAVARATRR